MTNKNVEFKNKLEKYIQRRLKEMDEVYALKYIEHRKTIQSFHNSLDKFNDREIAILSTSLLDNYLETIIKDVYIHDKKVGSIFKDEHLLQSYYSKVNIAYFSGLIPKWLFHDLILIGEIRNKFAHKFTVELKLNDESIAQRIGKCELRPKTLDGERDYRLKFVIIIAVAASVLKMLDATLENLRPPKLMEIMNMNEMDYQKMVLTKDEIKNITNKALKSDRH
jgi:DNA-binding MltR family transcriptional regulator